MKRREAESSRKDGSWERGSVEIRAGMQGALGEELMASGRLESSVQCSRKQGRREWSLMEEAVGVRV